MLSRGPGQSRFTLAVLVVISVTVLAMDLLGLGPIGLARDVANGLFSPVRAVGDAVFGNDDSDEVADLRLRIDELEGNEAEAANYLAELRRLQEELGLAIPSEIPTVSASVISQAVGNFDRTIEIDRGASDGVEVNMPVQTAEGLVGVIDQVTINSARVRLITDEEVSVGVVHVPSRDAGIARGQGEGQDLLVDGAFEAGTVVNEGDLFVTYGADGLNFPPDIPVGSAVAVRGAANPLEQQVFLSPLADLGSLSQVFVVLFTPTEAGATGEQPAEGGG